MFRQSLDLSLNKANLQFTRHWIDHSRSNRCLVSCFHTIETSQLYIWCNHDFEILDDFIYLAKKWSLRLYSPIWIKFNDIDILQWIPCAGVRLHEARRELHLPLRHEFFTDPVYVFLNYIELLRIKNCTNLVSRVVKRFLVRRDEMICENVSMVIESFT